MDGGVWAECGWRVRAVVSRAGVFCGPGPGGGKPAEKLLQQSKHTPKPRPRCPLVHCAPAPCLPPCSADPFCLDCGPNAASCRRCSSGLERVVRPDGAEAWAFPNVVYLAQEGGRGVCREVSCLEGEQAALDGWLEGLQDADACRSPRPTRCRKRCCLAPARCSAASTAARPAPARQTLLAAAATRAGPGSPAAACRCTALPVALAAGSGIAWPCSTTALACPPRPA